MRSWLFAHKCLCVSSCWRRSVRIWDTPLRFTSCWHFSSNTCCTLCHFISRLLNGYCTCFSCWKILNLTYKLAPKNLPHVQHTGLKKVMKISLVWMILLNCFASFWPCVIYAVGSEWWILRCNDPRKLKITVLVILSASGAKNGPFWNLQFIPMLLPLACCQIQEFLAKLFSYLGGAMQARGPFKGRGKLWKKCPEKNSFWHTQCRRLLARLT